MNARDRAIDELRDLLIQGRIEKGATKTERIEADGELWWTVRSSSAFAGCAVPSLGADALGAIASADPRFGRFFADVRSAETRSVDAADLARWLGECGRVDECDECEGGGRERLFGFECEHCGRDTAPPCDGDSCVDGRAWFGRARWVRIDGAVYDARALLPLVRQALSLGSRAARVVRVDVPWGGKGPGYALGLDSGSFVAALMMGSPTLVADAIYGEPWPAVEGENGGAL